MKKMLMTVISLVLVICIMMPSVYAAADSQTSYDSVMDYVTDAQSNDETDSKIRFVNGLSNFVINDFLGTVLKLIIPDSAAVADYEKFDIDEYDNFYEGTETFIDEPQGKKVWSLGYGKASVHPSDFGEKKYAKGAYVPYIFGNEMYTDEDGNEEDLMVRAVVMNDAAGYVVNPANFCLAGIQYNEEREDYDSDTWCLISYGKGAATAFISNFYEIFDSVR